MRWQVYRGGKVVCFVVAADRRAAVRVARVQGVRGPVGASPVGDAEYLSACRSAGFGVC